jgi:hypothetical protein
MKFPPSMAASLQAQRWKIPQATASQPETGCFPPMTEKE